MPKVVPRAAVGYARQLKIVYVECEKLLTIKMDHNAP